MSDNPVGSPILVPVDFSEHSAPVLVYAAKLADSLHAPLVVLHVVHDPGEAPGYYAQAIKKKKSARKLSEVAEEMMAEFLADVRKKHPKRKVLEEAQSMLVVGIPVPRILEVVKKIQPEMVVMGSQGRTGLKHILLGSKAEQVVQLCPIPVTIVKAKADKE